MEVKKMSGFLNNNGIVTRQSSTVDDTITPFGCCNFFDDCADGIFSLYYRGRLGLLDWLGFNPTDVCMRKVDFINYVRPEQDEGADTVGYIADPCDFPNGIEFGSCSLSVDHFGRYGRHGPTRDIWQPKYYCKTRPRYFFDGSPVTDEPTWDRFFIMDAMLNDVRVDVIQGNHATAGQFDGLNRWIRTGYDCAALDSWIVDWNGNAMDGTGGGAITINGNPVAGTYDIVDFLLDLFRNIKQRISWSPLLSNQTSKVGDVIIAAPSFLLRCLLDFYACWSVCPGAQYEEVVKNAKEIRDFRVTLNGGMFGDGQISLDGFTVPLMAYDWGTINGPTTGDLYLLTGSIGAQRIWEGEHLDAAVAVQAMNDYKAQENYVSYDNGRVLGWSVMANLCAIQNLWMMLRLFCFAPWAQVRFMDVTCHTPTGPLSPNPADTSFYPETSFSAAVCP
jgi:hypothetical protein